MGILMSVVVVFVVLDSVWTYQRLREIVDVSNKQTRSIKFLREQVKDLEMELAAKGMDERLAEMTREMKG